MENLTGKEKKVLDALTYLTDAHGQPPSLREIAEKTGFKSPNTVNYYLDKLKKKGFRLLPPSPVFRIPILGSVPAGPVATMAEEREDMLTLDASLVGNLSSDRGKIFALKVKGDSMVNAGICDKDLVIVRIQQTASEGDIVVARFGDEATVKYLKRLRPSGAFSGGLYLVPANEKYRPIPVRGPSEDDGAVIVGKVVSVIRRY